MSYQTQLPKPIFAHPDVGYQQNENIPLNSPPTLTKCVYHPCEVVPQNVPICPPTLERQCPSSICSKNTEEIVAELFGQKCKPYGPKNRECLTHLTSEQRRIRKNMKSRVWAQNVREEKKERSQKMEDFIRELVAENKRLLAENEMLRQQNDKFRCQSSLVGSYDNINRDRMVFESAVGTDHQSRIEQSQQIIPHKYCPSHSPTPSSINEIKLENADLIEIGKLHEDLKSRGIDLSQIVEDLENEENIKPSLSSPLSSYQKTMKEQSPDSLIVSPAPSYLGEVKDESVMYGNPDFGVRQTDLLFDFN